MADSGQFPNNILDHVLIAKDNIIDKNNVKNNLNSYTDSDSDYEEKTIKIKKNNYETEMNKVNKESWNEKEDTIILEEREKHKYGHTARVFERFAKESCSENKKSIRQIKLRSIFLKNKNLRYKNITNTPDQHEVKSTHHLDHVDKEDKNISIENNHQSNYDDNEM